MTSINISNHEFNVFQIDQTSNTLRLGRADLLSSFCSATFNTTTLPPKIFELSPTYKSLTVLYHCDPKLPYRSSYTCPALGHLLISQSLHYHHSCKDSFTVNVPTSFIPEKNELNLTHLESALRNGFEVKLVIDEIPCQECSSARGFCGFNSTTEICCNLTSPSGGVTCAPHHQPSANDLRRLCKAPFSCGDQEDLSYPFWIPGREYCGHPDFKLFCSGGFAELNISSVKFRILDMKNSSSIIRLARTDYIGALCPLNPLNTPIFEGILPFTKETEMLTLYYDCQFKLSANSTTSYIGELGCNSRKSYYVTRNLSSLLLDWLRKFCKRNVSVPASGPALKTLQRSPNQDNLKLALEQGFQLEVKSDCSMCVNSGGACGYNRTSNAFICYCEDRPHDLKCRLGQDGYSHRDQGTTRAVVSLIIIALLLLLVVITFSMLLSPSCGVKNFRKQKVSHDQRQQKLKALIPLKHYTFTEVIKFTNSFEEVVGRGGFGIVYRGTLCDGRMIAVKVLKTSKGNNSEDFINEVASMSQTSHVNIVSLLGFCCEGSKRAIIYEFLGNGSLDKFISDKTSINLGLKALYRIALGVACGLEYLHYGCKTRIVHFDIKPQNVLLDENFRAKVSDFGLAKLCKKKESVMSMLDMRGTIGYIAPEMFSRVYGSVSHKSDVYSYGMLVLEMIGARKKERYDQTSLSSASSMYFPEWIYKNLENGENGRLFENGISNEEEEIRKKMTLVGLWCIQSSPSNRPSTNKVVEMMEGSLDAFEVPPRLVLQQISVAPLSESFGVLDESPNTSEVLICSTK